MNKKISSLVLGTFFALAASLSLGAASAFAAGPTMIATPATGVSYTTATMNGAFDSSGCSTPPSGTDVRFEYGPTGSFSNQTAYQAMASASGSLASVALTGLTPGTTYNYRTMGINSCGTGFSSPAITFTTTAYALPNVITTPATGITMTSATLNGSFTSDGTSAVQTWFQYANNSGMLGASTTTASTQTNASGQFSATLSGLTPGTTYYFRAAAQQTSTGGTVYGTPALSFTTTSASGTTGSGTTTTGTGTTTTGGTTTGGTTGGTGGSSCVINSFTADSTSFAMGESTMLRWTTTNCTSGTIDNSIGSVSPISSGSVSTGMLNAAGSPTFTLTAYDSSGNQTTQAITIYVFTGPPSQSSCVIYSFQPASYSIYSGQSTTLSWATNANCVSAYVTNIGSVYPVTDGNTSTGALYSTTTYTLTATDSNGFNQTSQTTVGVMTYGGTTSGGTSGGTGYYGTTTGGYYNPDTNCMINAFYASPSVVPYEGTTTLYWNTSGCSSITIPGIGSSSNPSGSSMTGALYYTTTYTIYGYGPDSNSISESTTINVSGNNQPYYAPTQYNQYPSTSNPTNASVITTVATNIGSTTARLNGLVTSSTPASAYFEYGTTPSLGQTTSPQEVSGNDENYYTGISVASSTTYYYRADISADGLISQGNIVSFSTPSINSTRVIYYNTGSSGSAASGTGTSSTGGVTLTITDKGDKINIGDTVAYTIAYTNGSSKTLSNSILTIVFPQGFTAEQASQGQTVSPNTVEVNIGALAPGQTGSVFVEASVGESVPVGQTLVTTGTLNFTLPDGSRDSAVGYVLNHAGAASSLGGFALGSGFFPTTIFGWLVTILIILAVVLIARRIARSKNAAAQHDHGTGHGIGH